MDDVHSFDTAAGVKATIRAVETIPLNVPFETPFKISSGAPRAVVETLLVRIHTDQGVVGIGETQAWRRQGSAELLPNLVNQIKGQFEPLLIGRSPFRCRGDHAIDERHIVQFALRPGGGRRRALRRDGQAPERAGSTNCSAGNAATACASGRSSR